MKTERIRKKCSSRKIGRSWSPGARRGRESETGALGKMSTLVPFVLFEFVLCDGSFATAPKV